MKFFEPEQLRVFEKLPEDQRNTRIQEEFVPVANPAIPKSKKSGSRCGSPWLAALIHQSFGNHPFEPWIELKETEL